METVYPLCGTRLRKSNVYESTFCPISKSWCNLLSTMETSHHVLTPCCVPSSDSGRSGRGSVEHATPPRPSKQDDVAMSSSAAPANPSACLPTQSTKEISQSYSAVPACERIACSATSPEITPFAMRPLLSRTTASYSQCVTSPPFLPRSRTPEESSRVASASSSFRLPRISPLQLAVAVCEESEPIDAGSATAQPTTISEFSGIRSPNPAFPQSPTSLPAADEDQPSGSIKLPTPEEMMAQDMFNNCAVRFVVSGVMGESSFVPGGVLGFQILTCCTRLGEHSGRWPLEDMIGLCIIRHHSSLERLNVDGGMWRKKGSGISFRVERDVWSSG